MFLAAPDLVEHLGHTVRMPALGDHNLLHAQAEGLVHEAVGDLASLLGIADEVAVVCRLEQRDGPVGFSLVEDDGRWQDRVGSRESDVEDVGALLVHGDLCIRVAGDRLNLRFDVFEPIDDYVAEHLEVVALEDRRVGELLQHLVRHSSSGKDTLCHGQDPRGVDAERAVEHAATAAGAGVRGLVELLEQALVGVASFVEFRHELAGLGEVLLVDLADQFCTTGGQVLEVLCRHVLMTGVLADGAARADVEILLELAIHLLVDHAGECGNLLLLHVTHSSPGWPRRHRWCARAC